MNCDMTSQRQADTLRSSDEECYQQLLNILKTQQPSDKSQDTAFNVGFPSFSPGSSQSPLAKTLLQLLPYFPIIISIVSASLAVGNSPLYFNIRHLIIICGILGSWATSHGLGIAIRRSSFFGSKRLGFWLLILKNSVFALVPPMLLGMQSCGLFSTCQAWASIIVTRDAGLGFERVVLDSLDFQRNIDIYYPWLVGVLLVSQCVYAVVVWIWFRSGR
ncbi:hypothetical protein QBC43DRAFT_306785 [Cladorrhinum sp. PSN259]|nr:hypothetical protein QBC43DRAFT_306785 [Cladorrhinum sp. PSN259]